MSTPTPAERPPAGGAAAKSPRAFRTIAEVAAELDLPQHVLRFWETRFPQVRPLKRRGGRRYYRPEDVALLRRIRTWLYDEGYTIRGVQKLLRASKGAAPAAEATHQQSAAAPLPPPVAAELREVIAALEEIRRLLLGARTSATDPTETDGVPHEDR